jgi:hypothetical protein
MKITLLPLLDCAYEQERKESALHFHRPGFVYFHVPGCCGPPGKSAKGSGVAVAPPIDAPFGKETAPTRQTTSDGHGKQM